MSACRGSTVCFLFLYHPLPSWLLILATTSSSSSCPPFPSWLLTLAPPPSSSSCPTIRSTVLPFCGLSVHRLACGQLRQCSLEQRYSSTWTSSPSLAFLFILPSCNKCPCGQRYPLGSSCHTNFSLANFSSFLPL